MADDAYLCDFFWLHSATDTSRYYRHNSHGYFFLDVFCDAAVVSAPDSPCGDKAFSNEAQLEIEPEVRLYDNFAGKKQNRYPAEGCKCDKNAAYLPHKTAVR